MHKRAIIVGAGQAGLAMGYALLRCGLEPQKDFVIIDAAAPDSRSWKSRWESMTLLTPARYCSLPGIPFPGDPARRPRADEVAHYLEDYAAQLGLRPVWGTRAHAAEPMEDNHRLKIRTSDGDFETRNVIAATGAYAIPRAPASLGCRTVAGVNIHSSRYTHPKQIPPGRVLIVGSGNTGRQLARELSRTHEVTLATGTPRTALPRQFLGVDVFEWLTRTGVLALPAPGPARRRLTNREPVIGDTLQELTQLGVEVTGRLSGFTDDTFYVRNGTPVRPDSVIWATGYKPGFEWLPRSVQGSNGEVIQKRGETSIPGLYVLGVPQMRTRRSALISGVGSDALRIARLIRNRP